MTTARITRFLTLVLTLLAPLAMTGCAIGSKGRKLVEPSMTVAPYGAGRDIVIAVAPLRNESGVSAVRELAVTDTLVEAITQTQGLAALPTNRSLTALRALGLDAIRTPDEARALAEELGADGVVVGAITSWYPYDPPRVGMSLVLHARTRAMGGGGPAGFTDPAALQRAASDVGITLGAGTDLPVAAFSEIVDAGNHAVLSDVRDYAHGRHDPHTALGWEVYTKSVMRFTSYVSHRAVRSLLEQEHRRMHAMAETQDPSAAR